VITISHAKLEEKGFQNAKQYLTLRMYQGAVIAFENFRQNFPDSKYLEEVAYLKVLAQYKLADRSFPDLQPKRFRTVIELYQELVDQYPDSKFLRNAQDMYTDAKLRVEVKKPGTAGSN
jgi:outer membrane protein assembly factor BamD